MLISLEIIRFLCCGEEIGGGKKRCLDLVGFLGEFGTDFVEIFMSGSMPFLANATVSKRLDDRCLATEKSDAPDVVPIRSRREVF